MSHRHRLTGSVSRLPRGAGYFSGRGVGGKGGRARLSHRNFTPRPSARQFDGAMRTIVIGLRLLEEMKHVLRAIGRPYCKKTMISVL